MFFSRNNGSADTQPRGSQATLRAFSTFVSATTMTNSSPPKRDTTTRHQLLITLIFPTHLRTIAAPKTAPKRKRALLALTHGRESLPVQDDAKDADVKMRQGDARQGIRQKRFQLPSVRRAYALIVQVPLAHFVTHPARTRSNAQPYRAAT